jgi:hypothetical protein
MTATNAYLLRAAPALLERRLLSNQETEFGNRTASDVEAELRPREIESRHQGLGRT